MKKKVSYTASNTYETLNELTENTKYVWLVFHGIGYLSPYFIRHFRNLNARENYIICPQAPYKYYKSNDYKQVGASWLTKENTKIDLQNVLNYVDSVFNNEGLDLSKKKIIVLGYSQGVSIAARWLAIRKRFADILVTISGVFPKELIANDFSHLPSLKVFHSVGLNDEIFDPKNVKLQEERLKGYFPKITILNHKGGHIVPTELFEKYYS